MHLNVEKNIRLGKLLDQRNKRDAIIRQHEEAGLRRNTEQLREIANQFHALKQRENELQQERQRLIAARDAAVQNLLDKAI